MPAGSAAGFAPRTAVERPNILKAAPARHPRSTIFSSGPALWRVRARGVITESLEMTPGLLASRCAKAHHPRLAVLHWEKSWMPASAGMPEELRRRVKIAAAEQ
jgi:hypothetical protein